MPREKKKKASSSSSAVRFVTSAAASGVAETLTLPIDVTKVRLQTSYFGAGAGNQLQVGRRIVEAEGVAALWKGIGPALLRQMSYTGLSLVLYEPMRDFIAGKGVRKEDLPFWKRVLAGGSAGATSIFAMNWTDVLKARMQNSPTRLSFGGTFREIYTQHGVAGFWRGSAPNVARCFVGNACELGCYDQFKVALGATGCDEDSIATHFGASAGAGFVSAVFSTPVDVLKTRLQVTAGLQQTDSLLALALKIPREEGILAFYKGFWPLFQRKVIWTVAFFCCYEQFKQLVASSSSSNAKSTGK